MAAPSGTGRSGGTQMHSFTPRGAGFAQSWGGGDAAPMGRSGGTWNRGGGTAAGGNNNMGGGQPMTGGRGHAWGGGGGNRMGGSNMR